MKQLARIFLIGLLLLGIVSVPLIPVAQAVLPPVTNFAKVTASTGYNSSATSIVLLSGHGAKLPSTFPFPLVWWNATDYGAPEDDPFVEIVSVTARTSDTLTVVRAQDGTSAQNHNTGGKTYQMILTLTKAMWDAVRTDIAAASGGSALVFSGTGTPEGIVTAGVGAIFLRTNGSGDSTLYRKQTGSGNTGWVAQPITTDWSTPGAIGSTTPSTGAFTSVASSVLTLTGIAATYGATVSIDAAAATTHVIAATNATAFTILNPTNPATGRLLVVQVKNTSGGALGTVTWDTLYKMATFVKPANGFTRSAGFSYNGTNWTEIFCSPEVPN
jgi:hypothetical protein